MATKRRRRSKRTFLKVGDKVEARVGDDWKVGHVSRSLFRGIEVDVRLEDGKVVTNLVATQVRLLEKGDGLTLLDEKKKPLDWANEIKKVLKDVPKPTLDEEASKDELKPCEFYDMSFSIVRPTEHKTLFATLLKSRTPEKK